MTARTNDMPPTTNSPPHASLLGLPTELRNQIYGHIFISHDKTSIYCDNVSWHFRFELGLDNYSRTSPYPNHHPLHRLRINKRHNRTDASFVLMGSDSGHGDNYEHFAALFSVPCIYRTIHNEVMPVLADLPPISKIGFVFQDFTVDDMASWSDVSGEGNAAHMRKWVLHGTGILHESAVSR